LKNIHPMAQSYSSLPSYQTAMGALQAFIPYLAIYYYRWKGMVCESAVLNKLGRQMDPGYTLPMLQSDFSLQAYGRLTQLPENHPHCCLAMQVAAHTTWLPSHILRQIATYISSITRHSTPMGRLTMLHCKWFALHRMVSRAGLFCVPIHLPC